MNNIEQIKEALSKATPGPWSKEGCELWHRGESYGGDSPHAYIGDLKMMQDRNAHLIANAPTWLAYLIDELEKAQSEVKRQEDRYQTFFREYAFPAAQQRDKYYAENERLTAEHAAMKEALEEIAYDGELKLTLIGNVMHARHVLSTLQCPTE